MEASTMSEQHSETVDNAQNITGTTCPWQDIAYIYGGFADYAYCHITGSNSPADFLACGFDSIASSIPEGSTLVGLACTIRGHADGNTGTETAKIDYVRGYLNEWQGSDQVGVGVYTLPAGTPDQDHVFGGTTDTWGLTMEQIRDPDFRIRFRTRSNTVSKSGWVDTKIDWLSIIVYYEPPPPNKVAFVKGLRNGSAEAGVAGGHQSSWRKRP